MKQPNSSLIAESSQLPCEASDVEHERALSSSYSKGISKMHASLTINQLLGTPAAPESIFLFNAANDLSPQELAAIHGGSLSAFETATLIIGAAAVVAAGGGVLIAAGYVAAGVVTAAAAAGAAIGATAGAIYGG
jgi:hypothetical protein